MPNLVTNHPSLRREFEQSPASQRFDGKGWLWLFSRGRRARQHGTRYRFLYMHPSGQICRNSHASLTRAHLSGPRRHILFRVPRRAVAKLEEGHAKGKIVVAMPDSLLRWGADLN
jgi:hypothetical protein